MGNYFKTQSPLQIGSDFVYPITATIYKAFKLDEACDEFIWKRVS